MTTRNPIITQIESEQMSKEVPAFSTGDTVVVSVKVKEGARERLQAFEGVVIGKRNRGMNSAFTVRKVSYGVGVERTFQTFSNSPISEYSNMRKFCRLLRWKIQGFFHILFKHGINRTSEFFVMN